MIGLRSERAGLVILLAWLLVTTGGPAYEALRARRVVYDEPANALLSNVTGTTSTCTFSIPDGGGALAHDKEGCQYENNGGWHPDDEPCPCHAPLMVGTAAVTAKPWAASFEYGATKTIHIPILLQSDDRPLVVFPDDPEVPGCGGNAPEKWRPPCLRYVEVYTFDNRKISIDRKTGKVRRNAAP